MINSKKYIIMNWFPFWKGINFHRFDKQKTKYGYLYEWYLALGFWEIFKKHAMLEGEINQFVIKSKMEELQIKR